MTDLAAQLRALVDGGAPPVTMREIRRRGSPRPPASGSTRRPVWFAAAAAAALVLAIGGVVAFVARDTTPNRVADELDQVDDGRPFAATAEHAGDHWHVLLAANVCGEWLDPIPEFEIRANTPNVRAGIHTHGDGFIHVHPFSSDEEGANATLGRFFENAGLALGSDRFTWPSPPSQYSYLEGWSTSDGCPNDEPGRVRWSLNGEEQVGDPGDLRLRDGDCVVIAFLPEGRDLPVPPQATTAPIDDGAGSAPVTSCAAS